MLLRVCIVHCTKRVDCQVMIGCSSINHRADAVIANRSAMMMELVPADKVNIQLISVH